MVRELRGLAPSDDAGALRAKPIRTLGGTASTNTPGEAAANCRFCQPVFGGRDGSSPQSFHLRKTRMPDLASGSPALAIDALPEHWEQAHGYKPLPAETFSDIE